MKSKAIFLALLALSFGAQVRSSFAELVPDLPEEGEPAPITSSVRILIPDVLTNLYTRLDLALVDVNAMAGQYGSVSVELLAPAELRKSVTLNFPCTISATNEDARAAVVTRTDAKVTVSTNAVLRISNVAFAASEKPVVKIDRGGLLELSGAVDFGIPLGLAAVQTASTNGIFLTGAIDCGFTLDCGEAQEDGQVFGEAQDAVAAASAIKIVKFGDPNLEIRGVSASGDSMFLKWAAVDLPLEESVGYFVDAVGVTNTAARLDRLLEKFEMSPNARREIVLLGQPGPQWTRPVFVGEDLLIRGEGEVVIDSISESARFVVTNGTLTISDILFRNRRGANAFFTVSGTEMRRAKLVLTNNVTVANCENNATYGEGGAVHLDGKGCSLLLADTVITNCCASYYGGGVYAGAGAVVELKGATVVMDNYKKSVNEGNPNQNIYLRGTNPLLRVIGDMPGNRAVGVFYAGNVDAGNVGGTFATVDGRIEDDMAYADVFSNDRDGLGTQKAVYDADEKVLKWQLIANQHGKETKEELEELGLTPRVKVTYRDGGEPRVLYYDRLKYAVPELRGDADVALLKDDRSSVDLVITNAVTLCTDLEEAKGNKPLTFRRSANSSIVVKPGASLIVTNLNIFGCLYEEGVEPTVYDRPLVNAEGAEIVLKDGATVAHVRGDGNRAANAIVVWNGGRFTMESGACIFDSRNDYDERAAEYSVGAGLLVDHGTAYLNGGSVSNCAAHRAGGVFVGNMSKAFVSGDFEVVNCTDLLGGASGMTVADLSTLTMTGGLSGRRIGYTEGVAGDVNVFGTVAEDYAVAENLVVITNSVRRFRHDISGAYGVAATNASDATAPMLLVWATAFDEEGRFVRREGGENVEYRCIGAVPLHPAPVPVPLNIIYNGEEQTGVVARTGYTVGPTFAGTLAGEYTATATLEDGYHWADDFDDATRDVVWAIGKADYDMSGVSFTNATLIADGVPKSIFISGELPAGVTVSYAGNDQVQTGEYAVVAHFSGDSANYNPIEDMTATMTLIENPDPGPTPPDPPPGPEPIPVEVKPIAFKSIERITDTEWRLVITNRVPYCSYRLLWTTDLTKGFVNEGDWETAAADAEPEWTTNVITTGGAYFWKAEGRNGERPPEE